MGLVGDAITNWTAVEAVGTLVTAIAAIFAGIFAWRAWQATRATLEIEQARRADERAERRSASVDRVDGVRRSVETSDTGEALIIHNGSKSTIFNVVAGPDERFPSMPGLPHRFVGELGAGRNAEVSVDPDQSQMLQVTFTDVPGMQWVLTADWNEFPAPYQDWKPSEAGAATPPKGNRPSTS